MNKVTKLDRVRGSLIGGAAGDALGYPVEFLHRSEILSKYGKDGITSYELENGVAEISDDTQMTLFTANGMLMGLTRGYMRGIGGAPEFYVEYAYQDWYHTQDDTYDSFVGNDDKFSTHRHTWLSAIPALYDRRAPGTTCMSAIREILDHRTPKNNSKGCGGVMRVAPWPLFCACHEVRYNIEQIDVAGGEIARLTHKHPLGWMPAIVLTHIIYRIVKDESLSNLPLCEARAKFAAIVKEALNTLPKLRVEHNVSEVTWSQTDTLGRAFPADVFKLKELVNNALRLAENAESDAENIMQLGEGWVAEETLAIAVYAASRHMDNFSEALITAVNHDGDSDSTGAVAGNIMGAIIGYEAIPRSFKYFLELHNVILAIADDLHQGCIINEYEEMDTPEKRQWYDRYCRMLPTGVNRTEQDMEEKLGDIRETISWLEVANKYFHQHSSWVYDRLKGYDKKGNSVAFTHEEIEILRGALLDISKRIQRAAENL